MTTPRPRRIVPLAVLVMGLLLVGFTLAARPLPAGAAEGELRWGLHVTLAARWLDPAETEAFSTPFMVLYAVHDALVKPMPGGLNTPSLAESWQESKDHLTYTFTLRKNARFHNGEPVTAEDVKFSFERYKGASATLLKEKVKDVQVLGPTQVRFVLKEPWADFMTFYGTTASGAAWIVPKKYVQQVGEDGFKTAPVGAGPYKVVSFKPGVEIVMEAFDGYWRKAPSVKRLVMRSMPEETTRAAALKQRRGGHRLSPHRPHRGRHPQDARLHPEGAAALGRVLARAPRAVGSEVAVARPAGAPGRQLRHRPAGGEPGGDARLLAADREHRPAHLPVRGPLRSARLRSRPGQEAPGRGRLSQRLRRR